MEPQTNLSDATIAHLVRRAKAIIAGTERPDPIGPQNGVPTRSEQQSGHDGSTEQGQPDGPQWVRDWHNLQAVYGGHPTLCCTAANGVLAVLAWGDDEIDAVLDGLTAEESESVVIKFPDPPLDFVPVAPAEAGPGAAPLKQDPQETARVGSDSHAAAPDFGPPPVVAGAEHS